MDNKLDFRRYEIKNSYINEYRFKNLIFGFTELGFKKEYFYEIYKGKVLKELNQIHSNIIFLSDEIEKIDKEGDGIVLNNKNDIIVIRTADCTPLFFFSNDLKYKGILHVGWRGLYFSIIENLMENFIPKNYYEKMRFITGPSIERDCYEVGIELFEKFSIKDYGSEIFFKKNEEKYLMDVVLGIEKVLNFYGISDTNIIKTDICTFCNNNRFPSYRREKSEERIYNYMLFI